jgi:hypothetical protein
VNEKPPGQRLYHEVVGLVADKTFDVEFHGPYHSGTVIFFVHGFGVRRDSRELFADIAPACPYDLCVTADFCDPGHGGIHAVPFSVQKSRLSVMVEYTENRFRPRRLLFIGHLQGSIVISLYRPHGSRVLLLAPPVDSPYEKFISTPGWSRPGSLLNTAAASRLVRSDGIVDVDPDFWSEFMEVDAASIYQQLERDNEVFIVFAGAGEVLGEQEAPPGILFESMTGADHDFGGNSRKRLFRLDGGLV